MGLEPVSHSDTRRGPGPLSDSSEERNSCSRFHGCITDLPKTLVCSWVLGLRNSDRAQRDSEVQKVVPCLEADDPGDMCPLALPWGQAIACLTEPTLLPSLSPSVASPHEPCSWVPAGVCFRETGPCYVPSLMALNCRLPLPATPTPMKAYSHLHLDLRGISDFSCPSLSAWSAPWWWAVWWPPSIGPCPTTQNL